MCSEDEKNILTYRNDQGKNGIPLQPTCFHLITITSKNKKNEIMSILVTLGH